VVGVSVTLRVVYIGVHWLPDCGCMRFDRSLNATCVELIIPPLRAHHPRTALAGVVPLTESERAELRSARAAQAEEGGAWLEAAMGQSGGLEGLLAALETGEGGDEGAAAAAAAGGSR